MSGQVLVGLQAGDDDTHLICRHIDGSKFSWCIPVARVTRILGIGFIPDRITCPTCRNGSYFHLLAPKYEPGILPTQEA